jgi:hypothetical protein
MVFCEILYFLPLPDSTRDTVEMENPVLSEIVNKVSFFVNNYSTDTGQIYEISGKI